MKERSPILRFFEFAHLPEKLKDVSEPVCILAESVDEMLPDGAEKSAGLRKLLEAKDCFVRAALCVLFLLCLCAPSVADEAPQQFPRGAFRSPAHHILAAPAHRVLQDPPAQFARVPAQLDMWGNDQWGDCVSAEEAFAKACFSPEIFIDSNTVVDWARRHGYLNGADLASVLDTMQRDGFQAGPQQYDDGPKASVDYSSEPVLQSAIFTGPVKIAIDASALPPGASSKQNGWYTTDCGSKFPNTDHCVGLCGYGAAEYLYSQLGVPLPAALPGNMPGYLLFTWDSIGFVTHDWLMTTCAEAWVRNPTTVGNPPLRPTPAPPQPGPSPSRLTFVELLRLLIAFRHPHLSETQAAAVGEFFADDNSPHVEVLKSIVFRRAVEAGLVAPGTAIGAINWQQVIKIVVELEPLIVALLPLLLGDEQAALECHDVNDVMTLCAAGAPPGFRTQCGPNGCRLVPKEKPQGEKPESKTKVEAAPPARRPAGRRPARPRPPLRFFQGGVGA